jgi:chromosome segregation ATPase
MIGAIVGLVVLVLVRDKGIRAGITGMFDWVRRKIRVAKIKAQIQKENQRKEELVKKLGETVWKSGAEAPFIDAQLQEARTLSAQETEAAKKAEALDAEMEKGRQEWDEAKTQAESHIDGLEAELKPVEEQFKNFEKEMSGIEKEIKNHQKTLDKGEKDIRKAREYMEMVEADPGLSNIEKGQKREESERRVKSFESEMEASREALKSLDTRSEELKENNSGLEPQIKDLEARVAEAKEQLKTKKDQWEEALKGLEESHRSLNVKLVGIRKELDILFQKIGQLALETRVAHPDLAPVYVEIDGVDLALAKLQGRLKVNQSDSNGE